MCLLAANTIMVHPCSLNGKFAFRGATREVPSPEPSWRDHRLVHQDARRVPRNRAGHRINGRDFTPHAGTRNASMAEKDITIEVGTGVIFQPCPGGDVNKHPRSLCRFPIGVLEIEADTLYRIRSATSTGREAYERRNGRTEPWQGGTDSGVGARNIRPFPSSTKWAGAMRCQFAPDPERLPERDVEYENPFAMRRARRPNLPLAVLEGKCNCSNV